MAAQVTVFNVHTLKRNVPEKFKHLAPKTDEQEITIVIKNINAQIANAIRRTMMNELPMKYLKPTSFKCTDTNVLQEFIENRVQMIPISQAAKTGKEHSLSFTNNTNIIENVMTNFTPEVPCQTNIILCTIQPQTQIQIKVVVAESLPCLPKMSSIGVISNAVSVPYEFKGSIDSPVFEHQDYMITAINNGTIDSATLLDMTCENLLERLAKIKIIANACKTDNEVCDLFIANETSTTTMMVAKQILLDNPDVKFASQRSQTDNYCAYIMVHSRAPYDKIITACDKLSVICAKIRADLKSVIKYN